MLQQRMSAFYNAQCCGIAFEYQTVQLRRRHVGLADPVRPPLLPLVHARRPRQLLAVQRRAERRAALTRVDAGQRFSSPAPPGFAGSHLLDLLAGDGADVVAWHRPGGSAAAPTRAGIALGGGRSARSRRPVTRAIARARPAVGVPLRGRRARRHVAGSRPSRRFAINVRGTHHLLEGAAARGAARRASLIPELRDGLRARPTEALTEDDPLVPRSPVRRQQARAGDARRAREPATARTSRSRARSTISGPRQDPFFAASGFARRIADIEAGRWEPEISVGNLDARRDLTDVRDTVRAYRLILERGTPGRPYNVCSGRAITIRELLDRLLARARVPIRVTRRSGALRPERHAAAARRSDPDPDRARLAARDPARPDARRSARRLEKPRRRLDSRPGTAAHYKGEDTAKCPCSTSAAASPRRATSRRPSRPAAPRPDRGRPPRRRGPLPGSDLPVGAEPRQGMPFDWTLNPYRGCTHGCHYCFARRYHAQFEMNADDEFASVILVKSNFVDVLRARARSARRGQREQVAVGTATDPYQPIEGHYKLTRGVARGAARARERRSASSRRDRWSCATATCCSDCRARRRLHRLHERADGGRGRVADARARHRAPAAAAARRARAGRRRHQRRRADGADRPRLLVVAREARAHDQGDRRPRRALRRLQRDVPAGRHARRTS